MPNPSPPWLERAAGGLAFLVMLVLLALTIGSPAGAAPAPIIIIPTPALASGVDLPSLQPRLHAPPRRLPPDTLEAQAAAPAREVPAPAVPPVQEAPAMEVLVAQPAAQDAAPPTPVIRPSPFIVEADGTIRLPGVEDWMQNLPPEPTATPRPTVVSTPMPRNGPACRHGCP